MAMTAADIKVTMGADPGPLIAGVNQADAAVTGSGKKASAAGAVMGVASAGIFAGFGLAVSGAMTYEAAMNSVQASIGATSAQMEPLGALAMQIGAETAFSATQGAQAIEELGKAGVGIPDILNGAALSAAQLASATGTAIPMAANVMANAMNTFGIAGTDATRVADVMTAALNASSLDMNDFAAGMASAGTSAAALGIPIEDTAASLALFSNRGMSGADAGTSLRSMLTHLASPTAEASAKFAELGISAFNAQGEFVGMESLAGQLQTQMAGLTDEQRANALSTMFGADAQRVANILFDEGATGMAAMTAELQANGQAETAAKIRMQGLSGALESMKGSIDTLFISFGKLLLPVLTKVALGFTKLINGIVKLSSPIKAIILSVMGAVAVFGLFSGGFGALLATMGPVGAMLAPLAAGIGALLLPFILITAAVIGLYLAFTHNFLGIRDIVMSVVDPIVAFGTTFISAMTQAFDAGSKVNNLIYLFPAPLREMMTGFLLVADAVGDLYRVFKGGGFDALMDALPGKLGQLTDGLKQVVTGGLNALAHAFGQIDWAGLGSSLLSGILSGIEQYWPTVAGWLGTLGSLALEAIGNLLEWAVPRGIQLLSGLLSGLIEYWPTIRGWLSTLGSMALEAIGNLLQWAVPRGIQLLSGLLQGLIEYWPTIRGWLATLGGLAVEAMGNLLEWAVPRGIQLLSGLLQGLIEHWPTIQGWLGTLGSLAVAAIGSLLVWAVPRGIQLLSGLLSGAISYWPTISAWLATLPGLLVDGIGNLLEWAKPRGIQLLSGLLAGAIGYWPTISAWLATLPGLIVAGMGNLLEWLVPRGIQLLSGLLKGIIEYVPQFLLFWYITLPLLILDKLIDVVLWLAPKGKELLAGLLQGAAEYLPTVFDFLLNLPGLIGEQLVDVLKWLAPQGKQLLAGLLQGAVEYWPTIKKYLFSLAGLAIAELANVVGALAPRGERLMAGLYRGVVEYWDGNIRPWIKAIPDEAYAFLKGIAGALYKRGEQLISGIEDGAGIAWHDVIKPFFEAIPQKAKDFFIGAIGWLEQSGKDIIQGLINGLDAMLGPLDEKIGKILDKIWFINSFGDSPWPTMIANGRDIVQGLILGMGKELPGLQAQIKATVDTIIQPLPAMPAMATPHMGTAQSTTIHYVDNRTFTVDVDSLEDVASAASVIRDLQRDREMVYGGT